MGARFIPAGPIKPDTCNPTTDTRVGGQPGRYIECVNAARTNAIGNWIVDNGGKRFRIQASDLGAHRPEIERVIGSVAFVK